MYSPISFSNPVRNLLILRDSQFSNKLRRPDQPLNMTDLVALVANGGVTAVVAQRGKGKTTLSRNAARLIGRAFEDVKDFVTPMWSMIDIIARNAINSDSFKDSNDYDSFVLAGDGRSKWVSSLSGGELFFIDVMNSFRTSKFFISLSNENFLKQLSEVRSGSEEIALLEKEYLTTLPSSVQLSFKGKPDLFEFSDLNTRASEDSINLGSLIEIALFLDVMIGHSSTILTEEAGVDSGTIFRELGAEWLYLLDGLYGPRWLTVTEGPVFNDILVLSMLGACHLSSFSPAFASEMKPEGVGDNLGSMAGGLPPEVLWGMQSLSNSTNLLGGILIVELRDDFMPSNVDAETAKMFAHRLTASSRIAVYLSALGTGVVRFRSFGSDLGDDFDMRAVTISKDELDLTDVNSVFTSGSISRVDTDKQASLDKVPELGGIGNVEKNVVER